MLGDILLLLTLHLPETLDDPAAALYRPGQPGFLGGTRRIELGIDPVEGIYIAVHDLLMGSDGIAPHRQRPCVPIHDEIMSKCCLCASFLPFRKAVERGNGGEG